MKTQDTYSTTKVYTYPNAIVRVHIPDLTDEERALRHKMLYKAAEALLKGAKQ